MSEMLAARWKGLLPVALVLTFVVATGVPAAHAAEDLTLPGVNGGSLKSSSLENGTHIMVFFASWSPRCRTIVEQTERLEERFGDRARVLLVDFQEDAAAVRKFVAQHPTELPIYLDRDGAFSKRYAVTNLPHLVVLQEGRTRLETGFPADAAQAVAEALR